jgi:hypothetical protein
MQEGESGWDPEVKRFFVRIINTVAMGLLWMLTAAIAGIYFELGFFNGQPILNNIIFYTLLVASFILLIRYLVKKWKNV